MTYLNKTYVINLDHYQLTSLKHAIERIGYPHNNPCREDRFSELDTGDWLGEIYIKLEKALNPVVEC